MKRTKLLLTVLLGFLIPNFIQAQLPVSTSTQNKKALLEEFTGIHCPWCPQGHSIANGIKNDHPNDLYIINIHSGPFATPQGNEPDFRTSFGNDLMTTSGLNGFPSGTVNRRVFPNLSMNNGSTAMGRGEWETAVDEIISQPSYVNIALEGTVNLSTRELIIDVEIYFTGTTSSNNVNLNVALLQNNIVGPQDGSNGNPSGQLPNGQYNHNHVLRHLITGQWGTSISVNSNNVISEQLTYSIPTSINGVDVDLYNIEVLGFISEGQNEVINVDSGPITYVIPNHIDEIDAELLSNMSAPTELCNLQVTPKVTIKNNGQETLDTCHVSYILNNNTPITNAVFQDILPGQTYTYSFPDITVNPGVNSIAFEINTDADISSIDTNPNNNFTDDFTWVNVDATPFAESIIEGFENNLTTPAPNLHLINPSNLTVRKVQFNNGSAGGFGNSTTSFFWRNHINPVNEKASIVWDVLDFHHNGYELTFSSAYAQKNGENDKLEIEVSTDCGENWTSVWAEEGSNLSTGPLTPNNDFLPTSSQWKTNTVDLSLFDGEESILIKFTGYNDGGNNIFIDDINLSWPNSISINEKNKEFNIFPVVTNGVLNVQLNYTSVLKEQITVYNSLGMKMNKYSIESNNSSTTIDLSSFSPGTYFIEVNNTTKKFIVHQ